MVKKMKANPNSANRVVKSNSLLFINTISDRSPGIPHKIPKQYSLIFIILYYIL